MDFDTATEWAAMLKALAHPTRLQIVAELLKGTKCVNDIQDILPASQSNISQHLTVLRNAGVVDFAQNGALRCYYVSRPRLSSTIIALLREGESVVRYTREEIRLQKQSTDMACDTKTLGRNP